MATIPIPDAIRSPTIPTALPALILALLLAAVHPVGYIGGGFDDFHYLQAARCVTEHGWCIPPEHWARRFPLVLPVGWTIGLLGESRETLWIVPLLYSAVAIVLIAMVSEHEFGRRAAMVGALVFAISPLFSPGTLTLGIDVPELVFLLATILSLQRRSPFIAGIFFAIAIQCRPSVFSAGLSIGVFLLYRREFRSIGRMVAGFLLPIALEALVYAIGTGDPMLSWKLSLAHASLSSSQLNGVEHAIPLFNLRLIQGWKPVAGINAPWPISGLVNFIAAPEVRLLHFCCLLAVSVGWRSLDRRFLYLALASLAYFLMITFAFALDPTPRMFYPIIVCECVVIGVVAAQVKTGPAKICAAMLGVTLLVLSIGMKLRAEDYRASALVAASWLRNDPDLTIQPIYAERLALLHMHLPVYRGGHSRVVILERGSTCSSGADWWVKRFIVERGLKVDSNMVCIVRV